MADKPRVVIGMPRYSSAACFEAVQAMLCWPTKGACSVIAQLSPGTSLLNHCFNQLWAKALNLRASGATHFAMIHADIAPEAGWLDTLLGELLRLDADVVSAVVPIKSNYGLTSTALQVAEDLWGPPMPRRLTMTEVYGLPETFGSADVNHPLLLNTGLWVCDLTKPWCERIWFESLERIGRAPNGEFVAQCISEDWLFSARLHHEGAKLFATRKVKLTHRGERAYPNDSAWGEWETDQVYEEAVKEMAEQQKGELQCV